MATADELLRQLVKTHGLCICGATLPDLVQPHDWDCEVLKFLQTPRWQVWAIKYEVVNDRGEHATRIVAVSAESEYAAVKYLCSRVAIIVKRVELTERKPQRNERHLEGLIEHVFSDDTPAWEHA